MSTTTIASIFSGGVVSLSEILYTGFVLMVPIVAALIGLGVLVRYVVMWISGDYWGGSFGSTISNYRSRNFDRKDWEASTDRD